VKDFVSSVAKQKKHKRTSSTPAKKAGIPAMTKIAIALGGTGLLLFGIVSIIRALPWSDFVNRQGTETVLFFTEKVDQSGAAVVRFHFDSSRIDIYPLPSQLPVEVMGGYGTYRFQAAYPLLAMEGKDFEYVRSTLSLSVGILLDEIWRANVSVLNVADGPHLRGYLLQHFWQNSSISLSQKVAWLSLVMDKRTEVTVFPPLTALPAPEFQSLRFFEQEPLCTIALVNTTSTAGLAGRIDQLLAGQNFRVVRTVSDTTLVEKTTAVTADELPEDCPAVLQKLQRLVPGGMDHQRNREETVQYRADIVVKLGSDVAQ
jgi:hypothetical protein